MIWKILIGFFIVAMICITAYIVWNNRSSEKILTNFTTVLILGIMGLLATSLITLKEEKITDTYSSCLFVQKEPFVLMNYGIIMKSSRIQPIIFANNAIFRFLGVL